MRHIAIVGSGPAGYYTAEAAQKAFGDDVCVDIIDRLPVPYGLIRSGVAPDHQSIKAVYRRYEAVSLSGNVSFMGNVTVGRDVSIAELGECYDAVVLATGAPDDRRLDIPGAELAGVYGSAQFVGWYNGHPDFAGLDPAFDGSGAVVIGNGNVALDVARILAKTRAELTVSDIAAHALDAMDASRIARVTILGRRGPHQVAMTTKELGEFAHLERAQPFVAAGDLPPLADDAALEPGLRKSVTHLRTFAATPPTGKPLAIDFDFFAAPVRIEGAAARAGRPARVARVIVERTRLDGDGRAIGTGETYAIPANLVITCIGYATPPIDGVAYDPGSARFTNVDGRIGPGLYCVGWAKRGPSGTIGTNRPDGYGVIGLIAADIGAGGARAGRAGLAALLARRGVEAIGFDDWKRIEAAEAARARAGAPREKFTTVAELIAARAA